LSIQQTVLVFAGIPIAVVAVVYGLVYGMSGRQNSKRYRPGRPFTFAPVWFLSAPEALSGTAATQPALTSGGHHPELPVGAEPRPGAVGNASAPAGPLLAQAADAPGNQPAAQGETGGASDRW
jgi:hypothetical protein